MDMAVNDLSRSHDLERTVGVEQLKKGEHRIDNARLLDCALRATQ